MYCWIVAVRSSDELVKRNCNSRISWSFLNIVALFVMSVDDRYSRNILPTSNELSSRNVLAHS